MPSPGKEKDVAFRPDDVSKLSNATANAVRSWSAIEPSLGQYQWTTLDSWLQQAITSGKKIDLIVIS